MKLRELNDRYPNLIDAALEMKKWAFQCPSCESVYPGTAIEMRVSDDEWLGLRWGDKSYITCVKCKDVSVKDFVTCGRCGFTEEEMPDLDGASIGPVYGNPGGTLTTEPSKFNVETWKWPYDPCETKRLLSSPANAERLFDAIADKTRIVAKSFESLRKFLKI